MSQINFIRSLIWNIKFGVQFGFNWEYWNFKRPNLIFTKLNWLKSGTKSQEN
jgi:hypothetical protein